VKQIGEGIFQLESPGATVNVFLVQAGVPVLVDAGTPRSGPAIVGELAAANVTPQLILLTHGDFDHVGGAALVRAATGAQICAPAAERAMFTGEQPRARFIRALVRVVNRGRKTPMPSVDRWLADGDVVTGIEAIATPGHTPGHTSYRVGTTLIAGDALITGTRFREAVGMFIADRAESRRSIEKLARLDVDLAVSGHGRPAHDAKEKLAKLASTWK
jgi:glyoxylase-like metal-dependent hydrolase (beta-lactamase superfamily II)